MLLAEDLLLLLTDDETGRLAASGTEVDLALGGALLVELALLERVDIAGSDETVREGRLVARDDSPTGDSVLDEALRVVKHKEGKRPQAAVEALGKGARKRIYERLVGAGVLRAEADRVLGVFPRHRWPSQDATHESGVRADVVTALRDGATTAPRTGALVSLLLALHAVHKAVDPAAVGLSKKELNQNAQRVADGDWAARAVRQAIDSMYAVLAAVVSTSGAAH